MEELAGSGSFAGDARGPFRLCQGRGILAGRQAGGIRILRQHRRLWDSATGASLAATLKADTAVRQLSFSSDGQYLDTDRGRLGIGSLFPSVISPSRSKSASARERKREIFVNGTWVVRGMKKVLWLPSDHRATYAVVRNDVLAMGHASGRVSILVT